MPIEATTTINYDSYRKYYLFSFFQGTRSPWQARILLAVAPLLVITFLVLFLLNPADLINLAGLVIMLLLGLTLGLIMTLVPRRYYKSIEKLITIPNRYVFGDEQLQITLLDDRQGGQSVTRYEAMHKAFETADAFYIYLTPNQSCIVGRQDFSAGSAEDLHKLLQERLGQRFVVTKSALRLYPA